MTIGAGLFYDGKTSARHDVAVELTDKVLRVTDAQSRVLAEWRYDELESVATPDRIMRLARKHDPVAARLEVADPVLIATIDDYAEGIDRTGKLAKRQRGHVIAWTLAATVSLLLVAWFGVPVIAEKLAPIIPVSLERKLGAAVEMQTRAMLDTASASGVPFECGTGRGEAAGLAPFAKLIARLNQDAGLPVTVKASVVRRKEANAIALPGGTVYVFQGLIAKADNPDELAGVIAHEMGHLAHRDGTRSVLQGAGLSFLFGMLLGDFVGGGAVVVAARTVLQSSYTRDVETAADAYAVDLMNQIGGNARALGTLLTRIGGATEPGMKILMDHPDTRLRVSVINARARASNGTPLLDPAEWAALKKVCG